MNRRIGESLNYLAEKIALAQLGDFPLTGKTREGIEKHLDHLVNENVLSSKRGILLNYQIEGDSVPRMIDLVDSDDKTLLYFTRRGYAEELARKLKDIYPERIFTLCLSSVENLTSSYL